MFVSIEDLRLNYSNYCFSEKIEYWFDKDRYEFYTSEQIEKFGYDTENQEELKELLARNNIIPSFTVDEHEFQRSYIEGFRNKKLSEIFGKIHDKEEYDRKFSVYTENNNLDYFDDLIRFNREAAVRWCIENNIKYKII